MSQPTANMMEWYERIETNGFWALFASSAVALHHLAMAEREAKRQKTEKDTKMYVLKGSRKFENLRRW